MATPAPGLGQASDVTRPVLMIDPRCQEIVSGHVTMVTVEGGAVAGQIERLQSEATRLKVEKLELVGDEFTTEQLTAVYCRVSFSDSRLRELRVRRNDHSAVPFVDLIFALSKLEHVELYATYLSTEQLTAIYQMVDRKFTGKLKKLDVLDNDHSFVSKSLKRKVKLDERRWVK